MSYNIALIIKRFSRICVLFTFLKTRLPALWMYEYIIHIEVMVKQFLGRPWGFQEFEVPRFLDNRQTEEVKLSVLFTGHLYNQEIFLVTISVRSCVDPRAIMAWRKIHHRELKKRSSGLESIVSTDCANACPIFLYNNMKICRLHFLQRNFKQCPGLLHVNRWWMCEPLYFNCGAVRMVMLNEIRKVNDTDANLSVSATWSSMSSGTASWILCERYEVPPSSGLEVSAKPIGNCGYTGCNRRNGPNFGRVFLMLNYAEKTQNTYIQSWTVTEIMAREIWNFDSYYTLTDYQIDIKTGRNMWFE
jgi:hypothetical protein